MACALFAGSPNTVTVMLPHAVTVGSTTLPSGQYTISGMTMSFSKDGESWHFEKLFLEGDGTAYEFLK